MSHDIQVVELIRRAQAGDERAAEELLNTYLPQVRRYVRMRLKPALRREIDTLDVCQSVFGSFFVQLALGKFDIESPGQMVQLLATMARNRLINHVRIQEAARRDARRLHGLSVDEMNISGGAATASQIVIVKETLERIRGRLTPDELRICEKRIAGLDWKAIANGEGKSAQTLRKQHSRALERVSRSLGLSVMDFKVG
jgi:RNA polymerase sigma factor (sigma-70 family)